MKIKMYWPNCDLVFKDVKFNGEDAFFLECSLEEARKYVFSNLTEKEIEQCLRDYEPEPNQNLLNSGIETNRICVLVTKDQKSLLPA